MSYFSGGVHIAHDTSLDILSKRLAALESGEAIRSVLLRYCLAADRCDVEMMRTCYHDGAVDDHGFFSGDAKEFCQFVVDKLSELELSFHTIGNVVITADGGRYIAESQYIVLHRLRNWLGFTDFVHRGRYFDTFEQRDGDWRIIARMICQDGEHWHSTANLRFLFRSSANFPIQGGPGISDPHYLGPDYVTLIAERPRLETIWQGFKRLALVPVWLVRLLTVLPNLLFDKRFTNRGSR